eukprot:TRINITY_DN4922_c1_g3_i1.p1 TRINITY_DN4922_c1_g3~~TRINITY_DN4922_c1_g3_i1.p1  ORF type:complete len:619 (-),score=103.81 TRINITY_DN4922_c1_g3_i1:52-1908(-)
METATQQFCAVDVMDQVRKRQQVLHEFNALIAREEPALDALVQLAVTMCECPIGFISFVDWDAHKIRFPHRVGMRFSEVPLVEGESLCNDTVMSLTGEALLVDTSTTNYANSTYVVGEPYIGFYYGIGLVLNKEVGLPVGVLSVIDTKPRALEDHQKLTMRLLATAVVDHFQLQQTLARTQDQIASLREENHNLHVSVNSKDRALCPPERLKLQQQVNAEFVATLGHKLWGPVGVINASASRLDGTQLIPEQREYLHSISTAVGSLNSILDKTAHHLDRPQNEKQFVLQQILSEMLERIAMVYSLEESLTLKIDDTVPDQVFGDSTNLSLVLTYLVENAIKYSDLQAHSNILVWVTEVHASQPDVSEGPVDLTSSTASATTPSATTDTAPTTQTVWIDFVVSDHGTGMSRESASTLFQTLTQGDRSTTRVVGGLGLGLSTSQDLAQLMGGHIHVASKQKCEFTRSDAQCQPYLDVLSDADNGSLFILSIPLQLPSDTKTSDKMNESNIDSDNNDNSNNSSNDSNGNSTPRPWDQLLVPRQTHPLQIILSDLVAEQEQRHMHSPVTTPRFRNLLSQQHHSPLSPRSPRSPQSPQPARRISHPSESTTPSPADTPSPLGV